MADPNPFAQYAAPQRANPFAQYAPPAPAPRPATQPEMPPPREMLAQEIERGFADIRPPPIGDIRAGLLESERSIGAAPPSPADQIRMEAQQARENVAFGEAPPEARGLSGYGINRLQGYRSVLGQQGAEVRAIESEGPLKGEIVYRPQGDPNAPWMTVRDPRRLGSLRAFAEDPAAAMRDIQSIQATIVPEVLGGVAGAGGAALGEAVRGAAPTVARRAAPIAFAAALGAPARYFAELARMREGRRRGVIGPDIGDNEIESVAMNEAGWQATGEAAGLLLYGMLRSSALSRLPNMENISKADLDRGIEKFRQIVGDRADEVMTVGNVLKAIDHPSADLFLSWEKKMASTAGTRAYEVGSEKMRQQADVMAGRTAGAFGGMPTSLGASTEEIGKAIEQVTPGIGEFRTAVQGAVPPRVDVDTLKGSVTQSIKNAEQATKQTLQQAFQDTSSALAGSSTKLTESETIIKDLAAEQGEMLFPSLSKDQRKVVRDALSSFYDVTPAKAAIVYEDYMVPAVPRKVELKDISFDQIDKAVHDIRRTIRDGYRGEWRGDLAQLAEIEDALVRDRNRLIEGALGPQGVARLEDAEAGWRQMKDTFRRTDLNKAFQLKPGGARATSDADILESLTIDGDTAKAIAPYLSTADRESVRNLIRLQIADLGVDAGVGRANEIRAGVVRRALNDADSALNVFFSPREIGQFTDAAGIQELRRTMGVEAKKNISDWYKDFYAASNPSQATAVMGRLRANPNTAGMADTIGQMVRRDLWEQMTKEGAGGRGRVINPDMVDKLLANTGKGIPRLEWLVGTGAVDPGFPVRIQMISDALNAVYPKAPGVALPVAARDIGVLQALRTASFSTLGMLNAKARNARLLLKYAEGKVRDRAVRAMFDPVYFRNILASSQRTAGEAATAATMGQALTGASGDEPWEQNWTGAMSSFGQRSLEAAGGAMRRAGESVQGAMQ